MCYAIKVIWFEGDEEYLKEGDGDKTASFPSRERAENMKSFMLEGISDQVQSVNVVPFPKSELAN